MTILLQFLLGVLILWGLTNIVSTPYTAEGKKNNLSKTAPKTLSITDQFLELAAPLSAIIAKRIEIPETKRRKMQRDFTRVDIKVTPEVYYANTIVLGVVFFGIAGLTAFLNKIAITVLLLAYAGIMTYKQFRTVNIEIQKLNQRIIYAMPDFARTVTQSLKGEKDLSEIFRRYVEDIPDTPLQNDLRQTVIKLRSNENQERALSELDAAINIDVMSNFIAALIDVTRGVDQNDYMETVNRDMETLNRELLRKEALKIPRKFGKAITVAVVAALLNIAMPMLLQFLTNTASFGF